MHSRFFLLQGSIFLLMESNLLKKKKKIHTVQSISFVDFKRDALFGSEMWGQLENKGKEQKLAIIHSVGWDERKKTRQIRVEKLVPRIFFKHWALSFSQLFSGILHRFTPSSPASDLSPPFPQRYLYDLELSLLLTTSIHTRVSNIPLLARSSTCFPRRDLRL